MMDIATVIISEQRYIVIGASITYNSIVYASGSEFKGVFGVKSYTGYGSACEIIEVVSSGLEVLEISGGIFAEQLTIYSSDIEYSDYVRMTQPQIVYCRN